MLLPNYMGCLMQFYKSLSLYYTKMCFKILNFFIRKSVFLRSNLLYIYFLFEGQKGHLPLFTLYTCQFSGDTHKVVLLLWSAIPKWFFSPVDGDIFFFFVCKSGQSNLVALTSRFEYFYDDSKHKFAWIWLDSEARLSLISC
jgi:hypothetical protein